MRSDAKHRSDLAATQRPVPARFAACRAGSVAIIFALVLVPVAGIAAVALDYGHASAVRGRLQRAVDEAALVARDRVFLHDRALESLVRTHVAANLEGDLRDLPVSVHTSMDRRTVTVAMETTVPTSLMAIMGVKALPVAVVAEIHRTRPGPAAPTPATPAPGAPAPGLPPEAEEAARRLAARIAPSAGEPPSLPPSLPPELARAIERQLGTLDELARSRSPSPLSEAELAAEINRALAGARRR